MYDRNSFGFTGFQREVLMTEFVEYSLGMDLMTEKDLAQFLFRFTNLGHEVKLKK